MSSHQKRKIISSLRAMGWGYMLYKSKFSGLLALSMQWYMLFLALLMVWPPCVGHPVKTGCCNWQMEQESWNWMCLGRLESCLRAGSEVSSPTMGATAELCHPPVPLKPVEVNDWRSLEKWEKKASSLESARTQFSKQGSAGKLATWSHGDLWTHTSLRGPSFL